MLLLEGTCVHLRHDESKTSERERAGPLRELDGLGNLVQDPDGNVGEFHLIPMTIQVGVMPAIIGRLSDYVGAQWRRLRDEKRAEDERRSEEARQKRERRLLSYADCSWTQIKGSKFVYCRKNGRVFQLKPNNDKSLTLYRVQAVDDAANGEMIGRYRSRGDASKVVAKAAYDRSPGGKDQRKE